MAGKKVEEAKDSEDGHYQYDYNSDGRTPCKYGASCFQRNPLHQKKFKHPPKRKSQEENLESNKKAKLVEEEEEEEEKEKGTKEILNDSGISAGEDDDADSKLSPEEKIKKRFLVDMPSDFYSFWDFCKSIKLDSLKTYLNLKLVGPFDVLAEKLKSGLKSSAYLRHWRFYYDTPEFLTVIATTEDDSQFHMGYFRDDPNEMPAFVASNNANENCVFTSLGPNLFSALNAYIKTQLKDGKSKYTKIHADEIRALKTKLEKWAVDHEFSLEAKSEAMKSRQKAVVTSSFHRTGIVVPFNKKTEIGYRPLPETDAKLKKLMQSVVDSKTDEQRDENISKIQEIVTLVQFANDECDYGMGLELGLDLFSFGHEVFHPMIRHLLPLAYDLLNRPQYSQIISAHLEDRKKSGDLSAIS